MREPTSTEQSQKELVQGLLCGGEPALRALCALLGRVPAHRHLGKAARPFPSSRRWKFCI